VNPAGRVDARGMLGYDRFQTPAWIWGCAERAITGHGRKRAAESDTFGKLLGSWPEGLDAAFGK
jgi:hypothetical protein